MLKPGKRESEQGRNAGYQTGATGCPWMNVLQSDVIRGDCLSGSAQYGCVTTNNLTAHVSIVTQGCHVAAQKKPGTGLA